MIRSIITGVGGYLPERVLTNFDLEQMVETSDAWIQERTGIRSRHIANEDQTTSTLAVKAAEVALQNANLTGKDLDLIILATTTPDDTTPATAMRVQAALSATNAFAFDVQAACSGFMYALSVADKFIKAGTVKKALVIGAETLSRIVDWKDRNTCVLFGDGAGAVIVEAKEVVGTTDESGILDIILHSDGSLRDLLTTTGGVSRTQTAGYVHMEGREVFRHAVTNLSNVALEVIEKTGLQLSDIDYLVPHQANIRIIEGTAKKMDLPLEKVIITLPEQGNTSAASIPLALYEGIRSQKLEKGHLILLDAMGAGFTWAGALIRL